jgi:ketosteroid isomerase-like protein
MESTTLREILAEEMSQENVRLVRELTEAWQRREQEATFAFVHPEVEWDATRVAHVIPDAAEIFVGHDGVRTYWRRWLAAWSDLRFDIEDVRDAGDEVVLLVANQKQWGRHSGIATEVPPYGAVFSVKDGTITRVRWFPSQSEALQAAGLSE